MSRSRSVPKYRKHKNSGQAVVTLTDAQGYRRDVYLGPFGSAESKAEYERVLAEWLANGRKLPGKSGPATSLTVNELINPGFLGPCRAVLQKPDSSPSSELRDFKNSLRPFKYLYGLNQARDFGSVALKAIRELMVKEYKHPESGIRPAKVPRPRRHQPAHWAHQASVQVGG